MKRKLTLSVIFALWACIALQAQLFCGDQTLPLPVQSCDETVPLCDSQLDGFCGTMFPVGGNGPTPLCGAAMTSPQNITWMAFVAGTEDITMQFDIQNCVAGPTNPNNTNFGVQVGVYEDCDFENSIACEVDMANIGIFQLQLNGLTVGQTYYFFLDGWLGTVCDYLITIPSGTTSPLPPDPVQPIDGGQILACQGEEGVLISTPEVEWGTIYDWTLPPGAIIESSNTLGNEIFVNMGDTGGEICVNVSNACFPAAGPETCVPVTLFPVASSSFSDTYCIGGEYIHEGSGETFTGSGPHEVILEDASFRGCDSIISISLSTFALPPSDLFEGYCQDEGFFTYTDGDGNDYTEGTYPVTFFGASFQGCDSTVNLHVEEYLPTELIVEAAVCFGDSYQVCNEDFGLDGESIDIPVDCSPNFRGCDSTILLNLTVLNPTSFIEPPASIGCGANTSVFLDGFSAEGETFLWTTVDGDICGDASSQFPEVCTEGVYCLEAFSSTTTAGQGLIECSSGQYCVTVTSNSETPMSSVVTNNIGCNGDTDGSATITVSNTGIGPFTYDWTPNVSMTNTASSLPANTYTVVISAQGNGCSTTETIIIEEPGAIAIDFTNQTNVLCNGDNSASVTASPSGGTAPFTYLWCDGQTGQTAMNLPAGPCTVVVTDNSTCTNTATVTITEAAEMTIDMSETPIQCFGGTGSCVATPVGGTAPYSYLWCDGQTTETAMNLPAGSCAVVVTDANGCTATATGTLTEPDEIMTSTAQTDVLCDGDTNGTGTVTPTGGTGAFTYLWCDGQTTQTATGLGVGACSVVVTDANGCTQMDEVTLTAPNAMSLSTTQTDVLCNGESTGTGTAIPAGGTAPYAYLWCNGQTSPTGTGLPAGVCSVVVTDANGCTQMSEVTLTEPTALSVGVSSTDILCNGENNGTGTATPTGGTGPYTYQWCNGATTATATGLSLGTCQVIVTDDNGCSQTNSVDIAETSSISITMTSTDVLCDGGSDGTATATPTGGAGTFTYSWCNGQTTQTATGLEAGACQVIVTDANGCTETESVILTEPNPVNVTASASDLSCNGADDGTATASGSGGVGDFTYLWCDGQTTETATSLPAGPCEVIITDANGCTASAFAGPVEPDAVALMINSENVTCFGESDGTATVTPSGGSGTFSYLWCNGQGTPTAVGLDVGPCEVIVTDGNGCSATASVDLTQPNSALEVSGASQNATCGGDDGSISLTVSGGTPNYTYDWNDPAPDVQNPTGLGPGNYTVVVTDDNGCTATTTIGVMTASGLDAEATWTDVSCNGGSNGIVSIDVTGGTAPYSYDWDSPLIDADSPVGSSLPADIYNVVVSDADGCTFVTSANIEEPDAIEITGNATQEICGESDGTISTVVQGGTPPYDYTWSNGDTDANIEGLPAGNYTLDLVDFNGCTAEFEIAVSTPNQLEVSFTSQNVNCEGESDGSISLTVTGGVAPFTYDWDNAGPVPDPSGLSADTYNVVVTDDTGCSVTTQVEITEPTAIMAVGIIQQATCGNDNGSITLTVTGGTGPYEYLWSNGDTSDNPTDLPSGPITVDITDANGCTSIETYDVDTPPAITLSLSSVMASCFEGADGSIDLTVNGGTAPFEYDWTGGSIDQDPTGLTAGNYTVVVTDANNCAETTSIMVGEPTIIAITGSTTNATCGMTNGSASISATGGTPPYTYTWTGTPSTEPNPMDLGPGTYCVDVTDDNGCTMTECFDVETPDGLALTANTTDVICNGEMTGTADVAVAGGVGPFTYLWDNSETTPEITGLAAGSYDVVITDEGTGCTIVTTAIINEPDAIAISGNELQATCGDPNGSVSLTVGGGTGDYTYAWSPSGSTDQNPTGLDAVNHTVVVTDAAGCTEMFSIDVTSAPELTASATSTDVSCNGGNDGAVDITAQGGTTPYTYLWSNGSLDEDPTDFTAGTVTGTVTDFNGCTFEVMLDLGEPEAITMSSTTTDETCGESNGSISLTVDGGAAPYTYVWDTGLPDTPNPTGLTMGTYCVDIVDANGCVLTDCVDVTTPNALTVTPVVLGANCFGSSDGSINLTITGGVPPYTQLWTTGWNGEDLLDVPAGTYSVDVTDDSGCLVTVTEIVGEPTVIQISDVSTPAVCGMNNGTTDITATGGTPGYTYLWSNTSTEEDPDDFASGNYTVTVTDVNGCTGTHDISVVPPNGPMLSVTETHASCFGFSNGAVDLTIMGGAGPFTYAWDFGPITEDIADLPAGNYTVVVMDTDGCTYSKSALIEEPDVIVVTGNATDETCNLSNGTITTSVSGGTGPYTYMWTPSGSTMANPAGLAAVDHTVVVTDANGCTGTEIITVDAPNQLGGTITPTNVSCDGGSDGSITANVNGGNGPYTYSWTPNVSSDDTASDLPVGNYEIEVTDADGCIFTLSEILTAPPALAVTSSSTEATCGETNGSITLTVTGGVAGYEYEWTPTQGDIPDPTNLGAGTYSCIITDANGCTIEISENVDTPDMLSVTANGTDAACFDEASGSATAMASGGTGPFTYLWLPINDTDQNQTDLAAGNYTVVLTDEATGCTVSAPVSIGQPTEIMITSTTTDALCGEDNGTADVTASGGTSPYTYEWSTGSTDEDPTDFPAGGHVLVVTDANGCTGTESISIGSPNQPAVTVTEFGTSCNGDSDGGANLTVSGGIPPFTYLWSNGSTDQNLSGVPAGDYTVEITDGAGCPTTTTEQALITEPPVLTADALGQTDVSCNGDNDGDASLNIAGGTMPYTYLWTPSGETTADPQFLVAGTNTLLVTDANGCTVTETILLTEPDELTLSADPSSTLCGGGSDGSIDLTVLGGTTPYTYAWSNTSTDEDPTGLTAGNYVVLVTDTNGCTGTLNVTVEEPADVDVIITNVSEFGGFNLSCETSEDGSAEAVVSGGFAPYTYAWDNGSTGAMLSDVAAGTYSVIVTDANGCTGMSQVSLEAPGGMTVDFRIEDASCFGDNDGAVSVSGIEGGTPPYQYAIDDEEFNSTGLFGSLEGGQYEITVQDANGCTNSESVIITEPSEVVVDLGMDLEIQLGKDTFDIEAVVTAGGNIGVDSSSFQHWEWTQGRFFAENDTTIFDPLRGISPLETTLYEFLVVDTSGCVGIDQMLVTVIKDRKVYIPNAFSPNGDGWNDNFYIQTGPNQGVVQINTLKIFNRWGEIVYELNNFLPNNPEIGWDGMFKGKLMNQAVFVYYAEVEFKDGRVEVLQGNVNLLK